MAARLSIPPAGPGRAPILRLVAVGLLCLAACGPSTSGQAGGQPPVPRITPQASFSTQVASAVAAVRSALAAEGIRLDAPVVPYRPAEPPAVSGLPRAVLQAGVGDPDGGYVSVYEFPDSSQAAAGGQEFAEYLASGFGQTNYPLDAQFSLTQVGGALVFTWWSAELAADRELARRAFEAVSSVGVPIALVR